MKKLIPLLALLLIVGCQSFESNTLKTLELSRIAVVAATEAYGASCITKPCSDADNLKMERIFNTWKGWSLTTAEALKAYMMVKAQVDASLASPAAEVVAKAKVTAALTQTVTTETAVTSKGNLP